MDDVKKEALAAFRQAVEADEELAQKVGAAVEARDAQAMAALAQARGFALDAADFSPGGTSGADARELSDEELLAVAGGNKCSDAVDYIECALAAGFDWWRP